MSVVGIGTMGPSRRTDPTAARRLPEAFALQRALAARHLLAIRLWSQGLNGMVTLFDHADNVFSDRTPRRVCVTKADRRKGPGPLRRARARRTPRLVAVYGVEIDARGFIVWQLSKGHSRPGIPGGSARLGSTG